ncbi:MAG: SDR family oxidoreductase [Planctomycetota bacterium]|nr:SDR family oxidoreductase [Planctomycetota bacterium]
MNLDLSGRRALVCGGSQGIGKAAAHELAGFGAAVVVLARSRENAEKAAGSLPKPTEGVHQFIAADLSDPRAAADKVGGFIRAFGPIEIVVNNTGGPPPGATLDATPEQLIAAFNAQLVAAQLIASELLPGMKAARYGRIINVASTSVKQPIPGLAISNIVRAAVAAWAKSLSQEVAHFGITVNNVLPGFTSTERLASLVANKAKSRGVSEREVEKEMTASIPAGRFGAPEEIGAVVAFLASPAAAYVNGVNIPVDGGRLGTL